MSSGPFPTEPLPTAALLAGIGGLLVVSVLLSRAVGRLGLPLLLLFMLIGMIAGSEGLGLVAFEDYELTFRIGTVALALILYDGGLNTSLRVVKRSLPPATLLATVGVVLTAGVVGLFGRLIGLSWIEAFLLGVVISSTDAAAVFSILRGSGLKLKKQVGATLELESGLNDPMAVILTIGLTRAVVSEAPLGVRLVLDILLQLGVGAVLGLAIGFAGRWLVRRQLLAGGLYPVLTLALGFLAFGVPTIFFGSGFLAVYLAGVILGNGPLPYRPGLLRVHDSLAWFSQIVMFLALGLLVFPSQLLGVIGIGLGVAAVLALIARPLAVALCLLPFRFRAREHLFIGWIGLRGAVPIILATFPILAGADRGHMIFNIAFFVVVVSALVQGGSITWLARWLDLHVVQPPPPPATLEIASAQPQSADLLSFYIGSASAVRGNRISELPFPEGAAAMLIVRGRELIAPRGPTLLEAGDHVYIFCRPDDKDTMRLLFGQESE